MGGIFSVFLLGVGWAWYYLQTGAAWQLWQAERLSPSSFYFERGNYYFGAKAYDLDTAMSSFLRALEFTNVHNDPIKYQLGRIYFIRGELTLAVAYFTDQLREQPGYAKAYYMRGLTYGYQNNFELAAADFKTFLASKPESWAAHNDLVWVLFRAGEYGEAEQYARAGLEFSPNNAWLSNALGALLINQGRYAEAVEPLTVAVAGFAAMTEEDWGNAYPGNDPRVYEQGRVASIQSAENNLARAQASLQE